MRLVRAISRTWITPYQMLTENSLWPADDPLVLAHPQHFTEDLEPIVNRSAPAPVPEPKRGPGRPPRTTAIQQPIEAR